MGDIIRCIAIILILNNILLILAGFFFLIESIYSYNYKKRSHNIVIHGKKKEVQKVSLREKE